MVSNDAFCSECYRNALQCSRGKSVVCTVVYDEYSVKVEMPFTILNELLILEDGTVFN